MRPLAIHQDESGCCDSGVFVHVAQLLEGVAGERVGVERGTISGELGTSGRLRRESANRLPDGRERRDRGIDRE
jgi:hypothetical protein